MLRRLGILAGNLFLTGCAAVTHSDRPPFKGPVIKPLWHNADVRVADTPVVHDDLVLAPARPWSEDKKYLYGFALSTGKQVWKTEFAVTRIDTVADQFIRLTDAGGKSRTLDARTGRETKDGGANGADWLSKASFAGPRPPVIAGNRVYVYGGEPACTIQAFNGASGALLWKWQSPDTLISTLAADNDAAYVSIQSQDHGVVIAFDGATGKQRWTHPTARYFPEGPVLLDHDTVVVRDNPPGKEAPLARTGYVFRGLKTATGEKLWEATTPWKYDRWIAHEDRLLVSDGKPHAVLNEGGGTSPDSWLTSVDLRSGQEVWRTEVVELATFTLPAAGGGIAVVGSEPFGAGKPEVSGLWAWSTR